MCECLPGADLYSDERVIYLIETQTLSAWSAFAENSEAVSLNND